MADTDLEQLWQAIEKAGSIPSYIHQQLQSKGFLVARRATDNMDKRTLEKYREELKKEAAAKRQLRRAAWQAYKATHICYLGDGVYWSDEPNPDQWDLQNAEKRLLENQLPPLLKVTQLAEALGLTIPQLRALCYQREAATSSHYYRFEIPKRSGGSRAIWAPYLRLKTAQRWIHDQILGRLLVHGAAHGFLPGRSIASNAEVHTHSRLLLKLDIENFFPSISWRRIKGVFRKAGYNEQIATLLALLCTESPREVVRHAGKDYYIALGDRCLPQGAPTSPALTNVLCLRLDRRLSGLAQKQGWRYSRYADDLTFSLPATTAALPALGPLLGAIQSIVSDEGLRLNRDKTHVIHAGSAQTVTGLRVNDEHAPRVSRQLKRQIRAAIHNLQQGKPLPPGESLQRLRGYAAYIAMTDRKLGLRMLRDLATVPNPG